MRYLISALLAGVMFAAPASAGHSYRFDAAVRCRHYLTEDSAAHVKLVRYDTSGETLGLVYKCRRGY